MKNRTKFYAVDCWIPVAHCFKVEAKSEMEAYRIVREKVRKFMSNPTPAIMDILQDAGFEATDDYELEVSGEGPSEDDIEYH